MSRIARPGMGEIGRHQLLRDDGAGAWHCRTPGDREVRIWQSGMSGLVQEEQVRATDPEVFLWRGWLGFWPPRRKHRTAGIERRMMQGTATRISATWHDAEARHRRAAGADGNVLNASRANSGFAPSGDLRARMSQELLKRSKPERPSRCCKGPSLLHEAQRARPRVRSVGSAGAFIARGSRAIWWRKRLQQRLPRAFRTGA